MIKQFFKKVLISYLIIICCIYTPTAQAASWSFGGYNFGNGSLNIVKDGVRITTAVVDSAPIKSNLATRILGGAVRSANIIGTISMLTGLALDAVDYVLDPENNTVKYKTKDAYVSTNYTCYVGGVTYVNDVAAACSAEAARISDLNSNSGYAVSFDSYSGQTCKLKTYEKKNPSVYSFGTSQLSCTGTTPENPYRYLNPTNIADNIIERAAQGDADAQSEINAVVADLVNQGVYDAPINKAIADAATSTPTDPTTPTTPTDTEIDTSSITAAIQSLAKIIASASSNTADALKSVINTSIDKLLNRQQQMQGELVNVGSKVDSVGGQVVGVGDKVDNVGGKVVGVGDAVKDVGGKVVGLNDSVDKVGDKVVGVGDKVVGVGDKVDAAGDKVGTKVDAVGEKVTTVGDKVTGVGDKVGTKVDAVGEKVTTVGDKVTGVGDKVDAAGDKVADAVKESTKEITKKMDETKPKDFELPAFCSWASKVCDFIDWVKKDPELPQDDNTPLVKDDKDSSFVDEYANKSYVNFSGQCPAPPVFNIFGGQITFPMEIVCKACEQMSWVFISFAWLRAVMIVFFASKG